MARFYADIQGNRGGATRMGTEATGVRGHIRGWHIGAQVTCYVANDGTDRVTVYLTSGSSGSLPLKYLGTWKIGRDGNYDKED